MNEIFTVDGVAYNVGVESLQRRATIREGNGGGTTLDGTRRRDIIGTYYDYVLTVSADGMSQTDYDALYEILTSPEEEHIITVPYGQGALTFLAGIYATEDTLELFDDGATWGELSIEFVAMEPHRLPGGS